MSGYTRQGIKCANCKDYHPTVTDVRNCHLETQWEAEQMRAEYLAEQANERSFEDRGYWENQAFEQWERSRGVVDFSEALEASRNEWRQVILTGVRAHAQANYRNGWAPFIEAYNDDELMDELERVNGLAYQASDSDLVRIAVNALEPMAAMYRKLENEDNTERANRSYYPN